MPSALNIAGCISNNHNVFAGEPFARLLKSATRSDSRQRITGTRVIPKGAELEKGVQIKNVQLRSRTALIVARQETGANTPRGLPPLKLIPVHRPTTEHSRPPLRILLSRV